MAKNRLFAYDDYYKSLLRTERWRKLRCLKLSKSPCCESCAERRVYRRATEVHHRVPVMSVPVSQRQALMFDMDNLVSLCHRCHVEAHVRMGKQTAAERRRRESGLLDEFTRKYGLT